VAKNTKTHCQYKGRSLLIIAPKTGASIATLM